MNRLFMYWCIDSVALCLAILIVPGIYMPNNLVSLILAAGLFGIVSSLVRSLFWLFTCPIVLFTVLPLILTLNVLVLWFSSWLSHFFGFGFAINGLIPAMAGAVVVSTVRVIVTRFIHSQQQKWAFQQEQMWLNRLEQYKVWLEQERINWRLLAQQREQILKEQTLAVAELKGGHSDFLETQNQGQAMIELKPSPVSWRKRLHTVLYRWHDPIYHWYMRRGWTWIIPIKEKIKQTLVQ